MGKKYISSAQFLSHRCLQKFILVPRLICITRIMYMLLYFLNQRGAYISAVAFHNPRYCSTVVTTISLSLQLFWLLPYFILLLMRVFFQSHSLKINKLNYVLIPPKIMKITRNKRKTQSPKISWYYRDIVQKYRDISRYKIFGDTHPYYGIQITNT